MTQVLGLDIGGTALKLGRFDLAGNCLQTLTIDTPQPSYPEPVFAALRQAIPQLDPEQAAAAIGVGMPGPADTTGRIARIAINMEGWADVPLADWLETAFGLPTIIENDANCAGLGEHWLGAGRQFPNMILLTLGTGVGGAIFINDALYRGRSGAAGELGLITLRPEGTACRSGNRGSLEQHLSIGSIQKRTGKSPKALAALAHAGDSDALEFWHTYGEDLGTGLSSLIYVLTPDAIVIGGGISEGSEFFFPSTLATIQTRVMPTSCDHVKLLKAQLGNQAGMVGASKLAGQLLARSAAKQA
ncbi:ROK family protein [filamentous cyanobacterium LEGE 11480]|uniref:ROK family protein n=1 Tax=Romeriopsis navalis LEGE 11480 TaxID=2777977 RepID=A0A928VP85_9CYAN|nr:ROK family protein [Romeriopsis navalis]MBE9032166.1 ROK family protein [Romeriopsis navalis LEGE 11480]